MKWFLVLIAVAAVIPDIVSAQERREFYSGVRSLAMGGVGVATVNDETALLLNPAALGRLRDFYGTILDPELEVNNRVASIRKEQMISQPFTISKLADVARGNQNKFFHSRAQIFPSFVGKNFGIGLYGKNILDVEATSSQDLSTFYQDDFALILGYNLALFGGRMKIGVSGKVISRIEVNEVLDMSQSLDPSELADAGQLREGVGVGMDVGLQMTAPWALLPTLGAVLRDVGGTSFDKSSGVRGPDTVERPHLVKQDLDVGISISPIHANRIRSQWSLEYRGLLTASEETDKTKLMHFGGEFNFSDRFFVRLGYHQRYFTGGFELASEKTQFQLSTHGEEIGTAENPREDRRMTLKWALRF